MPETPTDVARATALGSIPVGPNDVQIMHPGCYAVLRTDGSAWWVDIHRERDDARLSAYPAGREYEARARFSEVTGLLWWQHPDVTMRGHHLHLAVSYAVPEADLATLVERFAALPGVADVIRDGDDGLVFGERMTPRADVDPDQATDAFEHVVIELDLADDGLPLPLADAVAAADRVAAVIAHSKHREQITDYGLSSGLVWSIDVHPNRNADSEPELLAVYTR